VGAGLTWLQEIDLDGESDDVERSFADSGSIGYQLMTGVDVDLTERFYLSGQFRYSGRGGTDLDAEGEDGRVSSIDYHPVTLGLGEGLRFQS